MNEVSCPSFIEVPFSLPRVSTRSSAVARCRSSRSLAGESLPIRERGPSIARRIDPLREVAASRLNRLTMPVGTALWGSFPRGAAGSRGGDSDASFAALGRGGSPLDSRDRCAADVRAGAGRLWFFGRSLSVTVPGYRGPGSGPVFASKLGPIPGSGYKGPMKAQTPRLTQFSHGAG